MNNLFNDIELIDKYLKGISLDNEREMVKTRLSQDKEFRRLFDDMELMIEGIKKTGQQTSKEHKLNHLRNYFTEAYGNVNERLDMDGGPTLPLGSKVGNESPFSSGLGKGKVISFAAAMLSNYKVAVAAAITLLIVSWFAIVQLSPTSEAELFAQNFQPFRNLDNSTRSGDQFANERKQAYAAYDREDFTQAAAMFESIIPESNNQLMDMFYLGNAYLASDQAQKAIEPLKKVMEAGTGLTALSKWYLSLAYLKTGQVELAKTMLTEIRNSKDEKAEQAGDILDKLQ